MIKQLIFVSSFIILVCGIPSENSCDPSSISGCAACYFYNLIMQLNTLGNVTGICY